jgi:outer membrane protein assembly factor BamA
VREDPDRFISPDGELQPGISDNTFDKLPFGALEAGMALSTLDHPANPKQGFRLQGTAEANLGLRSGIDHYLKLASDLALYLSPRLHPQVTLAGRTGVAHNVGQFPFFAANTIGGKTNLRGWRSTRFAGRTSFYQNAELRLKLLNFSTYIAIGELGVLGFFDNGRVWTDGEESKVWHQGYGGGLWALLFESFTFTGTLGLSEEETTVTFQFGFQF